ncbi:MAG TPA: SCO family protein [Anaeromyxobacteraceae bacterium]|nr:SCO family protein [Anaeromyxobacteraceae bacterium]
MNTPHSAPRRPPRWPGILLGASLAILVAGGAFLAFRPKPPPPLPVLAELPAFRLTDQEARPYGLAELRGQVWVASFIFTRCETVCPAIVAKMHGVMTRTADLGPALRLVSFSVDPQFDTPEVLRAYAKQRGADDDRWVFLTGDYQVMRDTVVDGLKIVMERGADGDPDAIFHGSHLVLVDGVGRIRGYYDTSTADVVERVARDARALVESGAGLSDAVARR